MSIEFIEQAFSFEYEGERIAATAHAPSKETTPVPVVIFCHGYTGNRIEQRYIFVRMARRLAQEGIASIRFDYRGCGESEGLFRDHTVLDYVADTIAAINAAKNLPSVDTRQIGLLGYSLGGCVASYAAYRCAEIKTVVLWAPVAFPWKLFFDRRPDFFPDDAFGADNLFVEYAGWEIGRKYVETLTSLDPVHALSQFKNPVLLCHGLQDTVVPPSHTEAYDAARNQNHLITETLLLPKSDHGFKPLQEDAQLLEDTLLWFKKHL
ncbi:MAG TPA: alpha/beta fold hydrolase [Candidatus Sumerlaeota bacterium]|nr:MAG: fermentation/respiration switch protein [candidate division BRC1 bacterium ADurb.Bin183]HOE63841.1 alpha/beta fold hydrolase [Candidatus Sumerlaeota bacterium]HRR30992.1 alpha/beta fold hydrolase [Candidatus Sumerlaeia bacterium]HON49945.1 alpha/beta fold hydrolase [Candidatus Sumerlaeota bacterium]HOR63807.1 alpha/beta fold hydrolase [Candidatus Sumerlaeota bacterium]